MTPRSVARHRGRLVTLTSDVGWAYAAQMKAVLLRSLPPGSIVDVTHDLPHHDVREAAFLLRSVAPQYPPGTVHVAVVDPGVGGRRAPLIIECADGSALVGPDNGVLAPLAHALGDPHGFRIDPSRLGTRPRVGTTFDGRDLFAPAAALLARGVPAARLGRPHPFLDLRIPAASRRPAGARGRVVHRDVFGNLITNIPTEWVPLTTRTVDVSFDGGRPRRVPWAGSYEALGRGRLGALGSSFGTVEVAVAEGRADVRCRTGPHASVGIAWARAKEVRAPRTVNRPANVRSGRR